MNKAKIIGALMASVLAAVPVANLTGNMLSFNNNAIVAQAANETAPSSWDGDRDYQKTGLSSYTVDFEGNYRFYASDTKPIMTSSQYGLFLTTKGSLEVRIRTGAYSWRTTKTIFKPKGSYYNPQYMLTMQWDGNFVVYAYRNYNFPIYYTGNEKNLANNGSKYKYTMKNSHGYLEYNGVFVKQLF